MPRYEVELPIQVGPTPGTTKDVSVSGVRLVTNVPLSKDDHVSFTFRFPQAVIGVPVSVDCEGSVIRVIPVDGNKFDIAITIDSLKVTPDEEPVS